MNDHAKYNVIINGSEGFVGSFLKKQFSSLGISFQCADIKLKKSINDCKGDSEKLNFVVHLAASISPRDSFDSPGEYYKNNIYSLIESLEWCRMNDAQIIFFSSYVYGENASIPTSEKDNTNGHNPYSQTKIIGENLCHSYQRDFNVPYIIFRPFNIYGAGQSNQFVISSIFDQISRGLTKISIQNPYPKRDFIYIKDVSEAVSLAIINNVSNETFNLCSQTNYSIKEVCELIESIFDKKIEFLFNEEFKRKGDVSVTLGDKSKISSILGWEPMYSLPDGLKEVLNSISQK
jgi:nucleoside-diphosphate-sugar epimerase